MDLSRQLRREVFFPYKNVLDLLAFGGGVAVGAVVNFVEHANTLETFGAGAVAYVVSYRVADRLVPQLPNEDSQTANYLRQNKD
jgi:hypothetical protein